MARGGTFRRARPVPGRGLMRQRQMSMRAQMAEQMNPMGVHEMQQDPMPLQTPRVKQQSLASAAVDYGLTPSQLAQWRLDRARDASGG